MIKDQKKGKIAGSGINEDDGRVIIGNPLSPAN